MFVYYIIRKHLIDVSKRRETSLFWNTILAVLTSFQNALKCLQEAALLWITTVMLSSMRSRNSADDLPACHNIPNLTNDLFCRIPNHSSTILKCLLKLLVDVTDSSAHLTTGGLFA